jgi:hypothetical protein
MPSERKPPAEPTAEPTPKVTAEPTRRTFLGLTAAGATFATAAGAIGWVSHAGLLERIALEVPPQPELPEPPKPLSETGVQLAALLVETLDTLSLPELTVAQWVNRYEAHRGPWKRRRALPRKVLQNFLMSTDFFPAADERKPLRFVAYYDPYISVCYNPLRRAD